jgi:hypothetical protein
MPTKKSAKKGASSTTNSSLPHICIDRVVPDEYQPARSSAERAILRSMSPGLIDASGGQVLPVTRAAIITIKKWPEDRRTLTCRFLDGDATQRKKVEAKAHIWEQHANVKFKFIAGGDAEIRISFGFDRGSWSALGTDALVEKYFPKYQPTMNFGWLKTDTSDTEYERVVVHEFGHALGLIHEHQNPKAKLKWNKAEVYRSFSGPPNYWTKEEIDFNILDRYSPKGIQGTKFDPDSIMLYMFSGSLFTDGKPTNTNTKLSQLDKSFIAGQYPF